MRVKHSLDASVQNIPNGFRLSIPGGDDKAYRFAQLDGYANLARRAFPLRPSRNLSLHARVSAESIPGTWGFGLWNDPFGLSLGFGGNPFRFPTLPNAIWFFHASDENYLSFGDKPGNGFLAQAFRSPKFSLTRLAKVALTFPFSRIKARSLMGEFIEEAGVRLDVDVTQWHGYKFEWSATRSVFLVDGEIVFETSVSPHPPLGLVIWIDNQYAAFTLEGKYGFGLLANTEPAWLEIKKFSLG